MEEISKKYFALIIALAAFLGLLLPSIGDSIRFLVMPSLFILMIFTVLKIDFYKILHSIKKPIPLIIAVTLSYAVIPFILYYLSILFNLDDNAKISVMFSALAPTILSAPYFVSIMKGDVEFSFVLSVVITLLAPFLIPLEMYFIFEKSIDFPYLEVFELIFLIVFIPIVIVQIMKFFSNKIVIKLSKAESSITALAFFIFIWAIIALNAHEILEMSELVFIMLLIGIVQEFGIFILIRKVSRIFWSDAMSKSFAFSIAIKNTALTAGVAAYSSNELALTSSIVVLLHVPMFAWIMQKKENI